MEPEKRLRESIEQAQIIKEETNQPEVVQNIKKGQQRLEEALDLINK